MSQPSSRLRSLDVLGGPGKGSSCAVGPEDDELLIGSDGACQLRLASPSVSPIHARVVIEGESASVLDTRSPKGLYVNDDRVVGEAAIREGDILWLGPPGDAASVMIIVRFGPVAAAPSLPPAPAKAPPPPTAVPAPVAPPVIPPVAPVEQRVAVSAAEEPVPFALDAPPERGAAPGDEFAFGEAPPLAGADRAGAVDDGFFVADGAAPDFAAAADSFFIDEVAPSAAPEVPAPPQPVAAPQAPGPEIAAPKELPRPAAPAQAEPARRAASAPATQARTPRPAGAPRRAGVSAAPRGRAGGPAWGMWVVLGALGLFLVGGGVFAVVPFLRGPVIRELSPGRVGVGQTVTLGGSGFGASPAENTVRFGTGQGGEGRRRVFDPARGRGSRGGHCSGPRPQAPCDGLRRCQDFGRARADRLPDTADSRPRARRRDAW